MNLEMNALYVHKQQIFGLNHQTVDGFESAYLGRKIMMEIFLPPSYYQRSDNTYKVLYLLDGQNVKELRLAETLSRLTYTGKIEETIVVAVFAGDRKREYGVSTAPDYENRGDKAKFHLLFFCNELVPFIDHHYRTSRKASETAVLGFSLSGLTAFDMVWSRPDFFSMAGICSGSFWWRKKKLGIGYKQTDRIMHSKIRESARQPGLKFWLQTGTEDEDNDRDNDGIIDSIGDTLDIIRELEKKGYTKGKDIRYLEVIGGQHNYPTWSLVLEDFLIWMYNK